MAAGPPAPSAPRALPCAHDSCPADDPLYLGALEGLTTVFVFVLHVGLLVSLVVAVAADVRAALKAAEQEEQRREQQCEPKVFEDDSRMSHARAVWGGGGLSAAGRQDAPLSSRVFSSFLVSSIRSVLRERPKQLLSRCRLPSNRRRSPPTAFDRPAIAVGGRPTAVG